MGCPWIRLETAAPSSTALNLALRQVRENGMFAPRQRFLPSYSAYLIVLDLCGSRNGLSVETDCAFRSHILGKVLRPCACWSDTIRIGYAPQDSAWVFVNCLHEEPSQPIRRAGLGQSRIALEERRQAMPVFRVCGSQSVDERLIFETDKPQQQSAEKADRRTLGSIAVPRRGFEHPQRPTGSSEWDDAKEIVDLSALPEHERL